MDQFAGAQRSNPSDDTRLLLLRVVMTIVALAAALWLHILTVRELPFHVDMKSSYATVKPRAGMAVPRGIAANDHLPLAAQSLPVRALLLDQNVPGGVAYPLVVEHGGHQATLPIRTVVQPSRGRFFEVIGNFSELVVLSLGLVTLWRGRDWSAWGLSIFALSVLIGNSVGQTPLPPYGNLIAEVIQNVFTGPGPLLGLYLTANHLVGRGAAANGWGTGLFIAALLAMPVLFLSSLPMVLFAGHDYRYASVLIIFFGLAFGLLAVPLVVLIRGHMAAKPEQRLRIKWILAGTALTVPLLTANMIHAVDLKASVDIRLLLSAFRAVLGSLIFAVYAFAVLSTRLVDVRIVINRAVVFTILMGSVVGLLALVESLIENSTLHGRASLVLEVAAPLILGIAFDQLQRRIELVVDRVFFRREHRARETLRDFVRDAGFIERAEVLVERMVAVFDHHAGGHGAVLYEVRTALFERSAQHGHRWPDAIDGDDPALVRLRATLAPLDLHGIQSGLGVGGVALPLALRGRLFGVLVCGPRSAGRYAQAEMSELGQAARDVGASLFALRARANEALVERLALGQVAPQDAAIEARQLSGLIT